MTTIQLLACIGMITGFFLLIGLAPMEFTDGLFSFLTREKSSIKDEIKAAQRRQKQGFLKREIRMAQDILTDVYKRQFVGRTVLQQHSRLWVSLLV